MSQFKDAATLLPAGNIYPLFKVLAGLGMDDIAALVAIAIASFSYVTREILWAKQEPGYHLFFESPQGKGVSSNRDAGARNIVEKMRGLVSSLASKLQELHAHIRTGQRCCSLLRIAKRQK
jgi:hypothetical protein